MSLSPILGDTKEKAGRLQKEIAPIIWLDFPISAVLSQAVAGQFSPPIRQTARGGDDEVLRDFRLLVNLHLPLIVQAADVRVEEGGDLDNESGTEARLHDIEPPLVWRDLPYPMDDKEVGSRLRQTGDVPDHLHIHAEEDVLVLEVPLEKAGE